ncbi:hypothetical protein [Lactobacillus acetotolerans]|uniref:hypothetical protein n=1 Tax=Lactobacillus acetotolerans TaxID=1600 RepID=UPI001EE3BC0B|nr:hypothetical protein [Lactobacillus acetotolerans]
MPASGPLKVHRGAIRFCVGSFELIWQVTLPDKAKLTEKIDDIVATIMGWTEQFKMKIVMTLFIMAAAY